MAIYPLEFYRRAEEKWRRRSELVRAAVTGSPSTKEGDDTLVRWPWLLAIESANGGAEVKPAPSP